MQRSSLARDLARLVTGDVTDDDAVLAASSTNFGHLERRRPRVRARPKDTRELARVIRFAYEHDIPFATRGAGHAQGPQGLTDGILCDITALDTVEPPNGDTIAVGAGARWWRVLQASVGAGRLVPVLTNHTGVTVGGTLSTGGIGPTSFRYGAQVETVQALEVVTPTGELVQCSVSEEAELFRHALAGLGQFGVIARAVISLRPMHEDCRQYVIKHDDFASFLADLAVLRATNDVSVIDAQAFPRHLESGKIAWSYRLSLRREDSREKLAATHDALLAKLHTRRVQHRDVRVRSLYPDVAPVEVADVEPHKTFAHPWMDFFVPEPLLRQLVPAALAALPAALCEDIVVLLWPMRGLARNLPMLVLPPGEVACFSVLASVPPARAEEARAVLESIEARLCSFGCKRYLSGVLSRDPAYWARHFGEAWPQLCEKKRAFDPKGIANPGVIPFT